MNSYVTLLCFPGKKPLIKYGDIVKDWDNTRYDVECKKVCKYALKFPAKKLSSMACVMQKMDNREMQSDTYI
jgi:hypothetical protein